MMVYEVFVKEWYETDEYYDPSNYTSLALCSTMTTAIDFAKNAARQKFDELNADKDDDQRVELISDASGRATVVMKMCGYDTIDGRIVYNTNEWHEVEEHKYEILGRELR